MSHKHIRQHGMIRGLDKIVGSNISQGRFGRMFRTLPSADYSDKALAALADKMTAARDFPPTPETEKDDEENSGISAGYTYLGQFIDHDLTFDPASSLQKENDPDGLVDFRSPRFDLDNVYGRGPDDQPYMYDVDGIKFLLGRSLEGSDFDKNVKDVPRNNPEKGNKRAIIGDPRNDENVIVSQLQAIMMRFHNRMVDVMKGEEFSTIQRSVRWHYQWVVFNDFLPTIIGRDTLFKILPHLKKGTNILEDKPNLNFYHWHIEPFMPVEFSVAAYRFGHSMVRPIYRLNQKIDRLEIFSADPNKSLNGFREFPSNWAIDWRLFFDFGNNPNPLSPERIQPAYKPDSSLVNPLADLVKAGIVTGVPSLAHRNLLRGKSMGLPSGQDVARFMGIKPIDDKKLVVGKANEDGMNGKGKDKNPPISEVNPEFKGKAPLWYYVLAEAQQAFKNNDTPLHLGEVGGTIIGEVFAGLMIGDRNSFFNMDPNWKPFDEFMNKGKFGMAELISQAKLG